MKLFTTPALTRNPETDTFVKNGFPYWFCGDETRQIFGIPRNTTKIWFEFYDRPGADRWLVEVIVDHDIGDIHSGDVLVSVDGIRYHILGDTARFLIRRLNCRKCYVVCFYEANNDV